MGFYLIKRRIFNFRRKKLKDKELQSKEKK